MHCAFALMIGATGFAVCRRWWAKAFWGFWPLLIVWVVIVTANHYWVDAVLGWLVALCLVRGRAGGAGADPARVLVVPDSGRRPRGRGLS